MIDRYRRIFPLIFITHSFSWYCVLKFFVYSPNRNLFRYAAKCRKAYTFRITRHPRRLISSLWNSIGKCTINRWSRPRNFGRKLRHNFTGKRRMTSTIFTRITSTLITDPYKLNGWKALLQTFATTYWTRTCVMGWVTK